jgi:flagellar hook-length control protein FliK
LAERTALPAEATSSPTTSTTSEQRAPVAASAPTSAPAAAAAAAKPVKAADALPPIDLGSPDVATDDTPPLSGPAGAAANAAHAAVIDAPASQISHAAIAALSQIAAQIVRRLEGRSTRFEMALRPDDLGRVDVKLDIDSDGRLTARLAFDNPLAATDLRGRADELRRQLEQAGFQLSDNALDFAERDSSSSAFDRGDDRRNDQGRAFTAASRLNAEADIAAQPPSWPPLTLSPSGVDMKV